MAGGTGGHVFPAIAVAQTLQKQEWDICWIGTKDRMEVQLVPKNMVSLFDLFKFLVCGKGIKALLNAPFAIFSCGVAGKKNYSRSKSLTLYLVWRNMFQPRWRYGKTLWCTNQFYI